MSEPLQLLQASVDESDDSHFRFLVNGKTIKYVTIATGLYTTEDLCFAPALLPLLPEFPAGDWNEGYISGSTESGVPSFEWTMRKILPTIKSNWHSTCIDHLELSYGQKLRFGVYEATSPKFKLPVVAKFARFPWEIDAVDDECKAYEWIDGRDVGPKFLGFITEGDRTIGFIIEKVTDAHHATPADLPLCQEALSKLHCLGVLHGDINKHNFLINSRRAILVDFECARISEDQSAFKEEMERLPKELNDTSGKGGSILCEDAC